MDGSRKQRALRLPVPDYDADDVLVVSEPEQLRALGGDLRRKIVALLRERARSTTGLAEALGLPKGTVGHHVKVLERAGLVRVVRTRRVRALTEKYYGRVARLYVIKSDDASVETTLAAAMLRQAADEVRVQPDGETSTLSLVHTRLRDADARRFTRRLEKLVDEFRGRETAGGEPFGLVVGLYRTEGGDD